VPGGGGGVPGGGGGVPSGGVPGGSGGVPSGGGGAPGSAVVPADPVALRDLLGTLETLAPMRRDSGAILAPALTLVLERGRASALRLLVAPGPSGPTDRVWMSLSGQPGRFLVDGYAARALDVSVDALRDRRPFRRLEAPTRIEITAGGHTALLTGSPWRIHHPSGPARAAPARVQNLLDSLSRLRISLFTGPPSRPAPALRLAVTAAAGKTSIAVYDPCPGGGALVETPLGTGCAPLDSIDETLADPDSWIDRALLAAPVDRVTRLRLTRAGRSIEVARADAPDALRDWLTRWSTAPAGPIVPAARLTSPIAHLDLDLDGLPRQQLDIAPLAGTRTLAALRPGDPIALVLHPWAATHLDPSPITFRSLDLLSLDPTSLRSATARRGPAILESIERGDTLEDWRAVSPPASTVSPTALDSLRQTLAFLRAERFTAPTPSPRHGLTPPRRTLDLTFDPPPGSTTPLHHTLDVGTPSGSGCHARLDQDPTVFELPATTCRALLGPWTTRRAAP
jgi:hypothetical protein